jgi:AAA family ATPase
MVVATTNRPHALDPALRRPGRFDKELELGPPSAMQRKDILRVLLRQTPHAVSNEDIELIAAKAHGYVGADLAAVVREAGTRAIRRWLASAPLGTSLPDKDDGCEPQLQLEDLLTALPAVRASALRVLAGPSHDDSVSSSRISFANVGGLGDVIQKLRECVEWPLKHPGRYSLWIRNVHRVGCYSTVHPDARKRCLCVRSPASRE